MTTAERPLTTAAQNLGVYFFTASEDRHAITLLLDFLEKCDPYDDLICSDIVKGWLKVCGAGEPQSKTELWLDFGTAIAETLAIDDGTFYDRSLYENGEMEADGKLAIRFIAAVPVAHKASFILGMGLGGFRTSQKNNGTNSNSDSDNSKTV